MPEHETDESPETSDTSDATPQDAGGISVGEFDPSDGPFGDEEWEGGHE